MELSDAYDGGLIKIRRTPSVRSSDWLGDFMFELDSYCYCLSSKGIIKMVPRCFQWVREKAGENMELLARQLLRIRYGKNSGSNGQASK